MASATDHALDLPPVYSLVTLREVGHAFAHACRIAPEAGAATLVWAARFGALDFAVVLEPDEPLALARRAFLAGMTALLDALAAHGPPERPLGWTWPATILVSGAELGRARLGWPPDCAEHAIPPWLVFAAELRVAADPGDPGEHADLTSLEEEGFASGEERAILESFARYLMLAFDTWRERGFRVLAERCAARLAPGPDGRRPVLGDDGDLLRTGRDGRTTERRALRQALSELAGSPGLAERRP